MTSRLTPALLIAGIVFFAAHVRTLPRTLEDIDSINFALGVEHFDVASHQPHPPGYPVFIALAKLSTRALSFIAPSWDRDRRAAAGLAVWGLLAGTAAIVVFTALWIAIGVRPLIAFLAALVATTSPPFWFSAARPLTDVTGLVAAVAVQTWLITELRALRREVVPLPRCPLWVAALAAGFIVGIRSQTIWLTGPLLLWTLVELLRQRRTRDAGAAVVAFAAGVLLWAVPLVWSSGGVGAYLNAVMAQGREDLTGIEMMARTPSWHLLMLTLRRTFVDIWQGTALAKAMLGLAMVGLVISVVRRTRLIGIVLVAFVPYLVFHTIFHETITLRYGLPMVVPVAGLAVVALSMAHVWVAAAGTIAIAVVNLVVAEPRLERYARDGAPVFRAFQDMQRALPAEREPPILRMHHQVWWGVRRAIDWYRPYWNVGPQPFPGDREWLDLVRHWTAGGTQPVWFLSEVTRNDVMLFDRRARTLHGRYEQPRELRRFMPGFRLDSLSWWSIQRPVWMLGSGWSLTPEIAGVTAQDSAGPHLRPAEAFLLRQRGAVRLMIGGRYLGGSGEPDGQLDLEMDGQPSAHWKVQANPGWFVQWVDLPALPDGESPYVRVAIRASSVVAARRAPAISLEQFDAAPADAVMYAVGEGWHEPEEEPATGRFWRWTSDRSELVIRGAPRDLRLVLAGESPLKYFARAPAIVVRAGDRELARFSPAGDFEQQIDLPAAAVSAAAGRVTIESDLTWVPGERQNSPDRRKLGLRLFRVEVNAR